MIPMSMSEVATIVGGRLADPSAGTRQVTGVSADSRMVAPGDLFVAITGERTDGHEHARAAVSCGAVGVVGSRETSGPTIVVDDPVAALGRLASHVRSSLTGLTVIGITGSSGKTTTKDLLAHLMPALGTTIAPHGSFNTEVGLPLTVLRADTQTRFLVLEMGMRGLGHIRYLCEIARPDVALILNVGSAHQEMLGSRDAIALAKGELVESLNGSGRSVLNADDPRVLAMQSRSAAPVLTFGLSPKSDVRATDVRVDGHARASFTLHHGDEAVPVRLQLTGAHMVSNALGAAAVALALGLSIESTGRLLSSAESQSRWRMEVSTSSSGIVVVNDAYNANPESMAAAMRALAAMDGSGRRWAVLGEMRELGADSDTLHEEVGRLAADLRLDRVTVVGEGARAIGRGLAGSAVECDLVEDSAAAADLVSCQARPRDIVLVKASRAVGLESVASAILTSGLGSTEGSRP